MTKKKIMAIPGDVWACGHYRIMEPYGKLASQEHENLEFEVYDFNKNNDVLADDLLRFLSKYDAILFQRVFDPTILSIMAALKAIGKTKVYMEIDDDLYNISQDSPAWNTWRKGGQALAVFSKALEIADAVHVSTPELVNAYYGRNKNFEIFYNAIDVTNPKYDLTKKARQQLPQDKTVVMWAGSSTHLDSIKEIRSAFKGVFENRPNAIFAVCSNPEFLQMMEIPEEQKFFINPVTVDKFFPIPGAGDIGLSPVKLNKFNDSKSELKCLEHGIWKVPVISSPAAPYNRFNIVSDGANLIAKKNKWQQWAKHVSDLIDHPRLREELGEKTYRAVHEHYNLDKINEKRVKFYEQELLK